MEILVSLQRLDLRTFAWIFQQGERKLAIPAAKAISRSADGYLHAALPLLLLALQVEGALDLVLLIALALLFERPLYWLLKNSLKRRRPQEAMPGFRSLITASDRFSFPSGHTSGAFLLTTALCLVFGGPCAAMLLWALAVALSRVLLGVHFPGDTLAGALMGSSCVLITASLLGIT